MDDVLLKRIQSLSPENRKKLELYLKDKGMEDISILASTKPLEEAGSNLDFSYPPGYYPASSAQKRLYLLHQIEEANTAYNISLVLLAEGMLDKTRFAESCQKIVKRHEALRTSFDLIDGEPFQKIYEEVNFEMNYIESEEGSVNDILRNLIQPFDLNHAPLFRMRLIKLADVKHIIVCDIHHIISDGASMRILIKEIFRVYYGQTLPEMKIQYKDFAIWQNEMMGNHHSGESNRNGNIGAHKISVADFKKQEEYWLNIFDDARSGEIPILDLATDFPRPPLQSFEGEIMSFRIEGDMALKLNKLASENGASLFMALLAALNVLLFRYTGQNDIIIGFPIAGRRGGDFDNVVGMFVNTLAMRNYPEGEKSFREFLREVKESSLKSYENQDYQFDTLVEKLNLKRDLSRNPLFDVMFNLQYMNLEEIEVPGLKIGNYEYSKPVSKFDITLEVLKSEKIIYCNLEYCTKLFKKETIERLKAHFIKILNVVTEQPEIKLRDIDMITEEEKQRIIMDFNDTNAEYSREKTIQQLIEEQVERTPDNIALCALECGDERQLTYRQLNNMANKLARKLRENGIKPDSIAGIMVKRAPALLIGLLGILKAGGAYLPLDPEYPKERIKYMLEDSKACLLLTQKDTWDKGDYGCNKVYLEDENLYSGDESNLENINKSGDLAYVIYTSGSTGAPKGVLIEHRSVNNFIKGVTDRIEFRPHKSILALTTVSFDIFALETLLPLTTGMKIVMADETAQKDPRTLIELIISKKIEMLQATPSRMQILMGAENSARVLGTLKEIMIGGEAFPRSLCDSLKEYPGCKIYNMYGPTETTVWSAVREMSGSESEAYIGGPIINTQLYILDKYHNPQPIGIPGELYISGDGLARGYLNRPELTAEKFIPNPFTARTRELRVGYQNKLASCESVIQSIGHESFGQGPGTEDSRLGTLDSQPVSGNSELRIQNSERMYRTGDLARRLPEGDIEFLGRIDHQVKIRGYRVETGEIETRLLQHELVTEAVTVVKEDDNGDKFLCAYFIAGRALTVAELRDHLAKTLPDYMIPSYFIQLEKLPLTPNGKIDRKVLASGKLPDAGGAVNTGIEFVAPQNEMEEKLADIWQEILGIERIGVNDRFFELGGDSMKAIRVRARLQSKYGLDFEVKDLFMQQTVKKLSSYIKAVLKANQGIISGETEFSQAQKWFWQDYQFADMHYWNSSQMFYTKHGFQKEILEAVLEKIVEHHDVLRTVFKMTVERVIQYTRGLEDARASKLYSLKVFDLTGDPECIGKIVQGAAEAQGSLDLANGPLLKLVLFQTDDGDHLLIIVHHLVSDAISLQILLEDILTGYRQKVSRQEISFPAKTVSFREWTGKLNRLANDEKFLAEIAYWRKMEDEKVAVLPKDKVVVESKNIDSAIYATVLLNAGETEKLSKLATKEYHTDIKDLIVTALGMAMKEWTGEDKILMEVQGHGRDDIFGGMDVSRTMGWFAMTFPVILNMSRMDDVRKQINSIKEMFLNIPNKGMGYQIIRYLTTTEAKRALKFNMKPEIFFNYLGQEEKPREVDFASAIEISPFAKYDTRSPNSERQKTFVIYMSISEAGLRFMIDYNQYEYEKSTILKITDLNRKNLLRMLDGQ